MGGGGTDSQYIVLSELLSDQAPFITSPKSLANYWGALPPLPPSVYGPVIYVLIDINYKMKITIMHVLLYINPPFGAKVASSK